METKIEEGQNIQNSLLADLLKVEGSRKALSPIEESIINYEAEPNEVVSWFYSMDPLSEKGTLNFLSQGPLVDIIWRDVFLKKDRESFIKEQAAAIVIGSVFFPEAFKEDQKKRPEIIDEICKKEVSHLITEPNNVLSAFDVFNMGLERAKTRLFSREDLKRLKIGTEMLAEAFSSGRILRFGIIEISKEFGSFINVSDERLIDEELKLIDHDLKNDFLCKKIQRFIISQTLENGDQSIETKFLGLDCQCDLISASSDPLKRENKNEVYLKMLKFIENVYLKSGVLSKKKIDPSIRGSLYEYLWFLDANLYLELNNLNLDIIVWKSHSYQDRPEVGYPDFRRGFDIQLNNFLKNSTQLVQLKSRTSPHFSKKYHPVIATISEQNFMDINPKRLNAKLNTYREFITSGFSEKLLTEVEKYLLPSVPKAIIDFVRKAPNTTDFFRDIYGIKSNIVPRTRAERRRAYKILRKKKIVI